MNAVIGKAQRSQDGRGGVAAADHGEPPSTALIVCGHRPGALGERGELEHSDRPVPEHGLRAASLRELPRGAGPMSSASTRWGCGPAATPGDAPRPRPVGDHEIHRQHHFPALSSTRRHLPIWSASSNESPDLVALGRQEREAIPPPIK